MLKTKRTNKLSLRCPGEYLGSVLEDAGLTAKTVAVALRVPANRLTEILNGRRAITVVLAITAVAFFGWFAAIFVLVLVLAYTFPSTTNRIEFPGAGKVVWPLVGLLFLATVALAWLAISSQTP